MHAHRHHPAVAGVRNVSWLHQRRGTNRLTIDEITLSYKQTAIDQCIQWTFLIWILIVGLLRVSVTPTVTVHQTVGPCRWPRWCAGHRQADTHTHPHTHTHTHMHTLAQADGYATFDRGHSTATKITETMRVIDHSANVSNLDRRMRWWWHMERRWAAGATHGWPDDVLLIGRANVWRQFGTEDWITYLACQLTSTSSPESVKAFVDILSPNSLRREFVYMAHQHR